MVNAKGSAAAINLQGHFAIAKLRMYANEDSAAF